MELVKLVKDNLKDIIDGTAIATADGTGAVQKTKTKRANSTPSPFSLSCDFCLPRLPSETSIFFCFTGVGPADRTGVISVRYSNSVISVNSARDY